MFPPTVTAASTQMDGRPTDSLNNMGIDQISLYLLQYQKYDMNRIACFGLSIKIKSSYRTPDESPETGINAAVNAIKNSNECIRYPQNSLV